jgi:hypothetical protein
MLNAGPIVKKKIEDLEIILVDIPLEKYRPS